MSESRPDPLGLLLRETSVYPLSVREGEKPILDEPITYAEMYRRKMSKDLELARLKKLAKEGEAKEQHDKASLEAKSTEEILAQRNLSMSAIFKSRESTEK